MGYPWYPGYYEERRRPQPTLGPGDHLKFIYSGKNIGGRKFTVGQVYTVLREPVETNDSSAKPFDLTWWCFLTDDSGEFEFAPCEWFVKVN